MKKYELVENESFGISLIAHKKNMDISEIGVEELLHLFHKYQLVTLRGFKSFVTDDCFISFCEGFGEIALWPFGKILELVEHENPKDHIFDFRYVPLHWDGMYRTHIPEFQIFNCKKAPPKGRGGRTTFSHSSMAIEGLHPEVIAGLELSSGTYARKMEFYNSKTTSPIITNHPYKDLKVIRYNEPPGLETFINRPELNFEIHKGIENFHGLMKESLYSPKNFFAHEWEEGDVVIADNFILLHGREEFRSMDPRHIQRVHVNGQSPFKNPGLESYHE